MSNFGFNPFNPGGYPFQAQQNLNANVVDPAANEEILILPSEDPANPGFVAIPVSDFGMTNPGRFPFSALFLDPTLLLNCEETSLFLKEAMKLPEEVRMTLLELALDASPEDLKQAEQQTLSQLIEQNMPGLTVPLGAIQTLLMQNTKEANEKLMSLLQGASMGQSGGTAQVAELASSLGKLSQAIQTSPQRALETLVLLYLPWYPLPPQQKLILSFEIPAEHENSGGSEKEISVVIFLETNTLGRFKIVVSELSPLQVVMHIFHEVIAQNLMPNLQQAFDAHLAREGLAQALFNATVIRTESINTTAQIQNKTGIAGFKEITQQPDRKELKVQAGQHISLLVLHCAYTLARLIFEADEQNRPLQKKIKNQ